MSLTVQHVDVYLEDHAAGESVLFLHGVPDSAQMWDGVIGRLASLYRCLAPDLPGLGRSVAPANFACRLPHMASFIEDLVRAIHPPLPLNLVVTDFGATYGLAWAVTHPEKVRKLAIVGGVNFFTDYRWHSNARLLRVPLLGELAMATMTRASFIKTMAPTAPRLPPEHFGTIYDLSMARLSVRRMVLRLYRSITPRDFVSWEDRLLAFTSKVPTLVPWGDKDPFISPAYAERFGAACVEHFPENGHWLAIEAPAEVAQRLTAFLTADAPGV
jgi:pimeloyl-ACP methyl ester carboxylesterase